MKIGMALLLSICVALSTLHCLSVNCQSQDARINGRKLADLLDNLVNQEGLGHSRLQGIYDRNSDLFFKKVLHGEDVLGQVVGKLGDRFGEAVTSVNALKTAIEKNYDSFDSDHGRHEECCQVEDSVWEYQTHIKRKVNLDELCFRLGVNTPLNSVKPVSHSILDVMKNNFAANEKAYWQSYATEEGVMVVYPSHKTDDCDNYDPRFRPFYVETTTPKHKDIVLVIDRSASMDIENMNLAIIAANTVVGTLNPNDRMGLVYFSDEAFTPVISGKYNCMSENLAFATPENKKQLQTFIGSITSQGSTKYIPALQRAFALLNSSAPTKELVRDQAILFLTDGKPDESAQNIITYVKDMSGTGVIMLTYGLGEKFGKEGEELLLNLTNSYHSSQRQGIFKRVLDANNLRFEMGSYYNAFMTHSRVDDVIISIPYVDYSGAGLITSICMPIHHKSIFRGVACIDYSMADLISDISYYSSAEQSYTFVIDGTGRVMLHPLLPQPADVIDFNWTPVFIGISTLERSNGAEKIISSMRRGENGSLTIGIELVVSNGEARRDGVASFPRQATYSWTPIANTNFSLAIVVPEGTQSVDYLTDELRARSISSKFIYHRMDLDSSLQLCSHVGRIATRDGVNVKFTPVAFSEPLSYVNKEETNRDDIIRYKEYMEGRDSLQPDVKLKDGIRSIVAQTEGVFDVWNKITQYTRNILWRYAGLEAGAFIVFPGFASDKRYDHTKRPWYRRSLANPGKLAFSSPYTDAGGLGVVVTISKTLLEGRSGGHSPNDAVIGVMGMDFALASIKIFLDDAFPACQMSSYSCFLLDSSGYLVFHEDFLKDSSSEHTEFIHVIKKEPQIARVLIKLAYLTRQSCDDFEDKDNYNTWKLSKFPTGVIEHLHQAPSFEAEWVPDSNVFLFIKNNSRSSVADCICPVVGREILQCKNRSRSSCECPCRNTTEFDYCRNTFPYKRDRPAPCVLDTVFVEFHSPVPNETQLADSLDPCYVINCTGLDLWRCRSVPFCVWCASLSKSAECRVRASCPHPETSTPRVTSQAFNNTDLPKGPAELKLEAVIGGAAGGIIVILLVVIAIVVYKRKSTGQPGRQDLFFSPSSASSCGTELSSTFDNRPRLMTKSPIYHEPDNQSLG